MWMSALLEDEAELHGSDVECRGVSIDSRTLRPGDIFVAIKGERFDGEDFVSLACSRGAAAAVVRQIHSGLDATQYLVADTLEAMTAMAARKRQAMSAKVVAITGSSGKTSAKNMMQSVLSQAGKSFATKGNLNNHIGVPLTILNAPEDLDYLIVEAGTSGKGEIAHLAGLIDPDVALVLNVQLAHVAGFGSEEAIAREKFDLYVSGRRHPKRILNASNKRFEQFSSWFEDADAIVFSAREELELATATVLARKTKLDELGRPGFDLIVANEQAQTVQLNVVGEHQVENAVAVAASAFALGVGISDIKRGLEAYAGEAGRMEAFAVSNALLVDDSYNANPGSVRAAIDYLSRREPNVLVLGDMAELGEIEQREHVAIGKYAREKGIERLFVTGKCATDYVQGYGDGGKIFANKDALVAALLPLLSQKNTILIKGSHSARMDQVVSALLEENKKCSIG